MGRVYHNRFFAMGTRFNALLPDVDDGEADQIFYLIEDEVKRIESKISRFIPESEISQINTLASKQEVPLDDELFDIITACRFCWDITDGAFDFTLRPLMNFWKQPGAGQAGTQFSRLKENLGFDRVKIDDENRTIRFENEAIEIDLGGFGKGYALEKVKDLLEKQSVENAFITFGESSVFALGHHPAGGRWKIGMNDYLKPGKSLHEFRLNGGSVSTSSNFFVDDNGNLRNHKHIINPESGKPHKTFSSVSVASASPVLAEMMSTAFLVSPDGKIKEIKNRYDDMDVIKVDYESGQSVVNLL